MRMRPVTLLASVVVAGCGGMPGDDRGVVTPASAPVAEATSGFVITISDMTFSPPDLAVPPGATVTVVNADGLPHSATSEATPGSYTPGAPVGLPPFDTGAFSSGQRTFTVPANAPAGTMIPYYSAADATSMMMGMTMMLPPSATLTIDPRATPSPGQPGPMMSGTGAM